MCNFSYILSVALSVLPLPSLAKSGRAVLPSVELFDCREGPFSTMYLCCDCKNAFSKSSRLYQSCSPMVFVVPTFLR